MFTREKRCIQSFNSISSQFVGVYPACFIYSFCRCDSGHILGLFCWAWGYFQARKIIGLEPGIYFNIFCWGSSQVSWSNKFIVVTQQIYHCYTWSQKWILGVVNQHDSSALEFWHEKWTVLFWVIAQTWSIDNSTCSCLDWCESSVCLIHHRYPSLPLLLWRMNTQIWFLCLLNLLSFIWCAFPFF